MNQKFDIVDKFDLWNEHCENWIDRSSLLSQKDIQSSKDEREKADVILNGFISTYLLLSAVEMNLFDVLYETPLNLSELSERLKVPEKNVYRLVYMLEKIRLVTIKEKVEVTDFAKKFFIPASDSFEPYLWPRIGFTRLFLKKYGPMFLEMVKTDVQLDEIHWPPKNETESRNFEPIMTAEVPYLASFLSQHLLSIGQKDVTMLDVGGGDGTMASILVKQHLGLSIDILNLPSACSIIEKTLSRWDTMTKITVYPANFLQDNFPKGYDKILFSRILVDWEDVIVCMLLKKAFNALKPKGEIYILERINKPDGISRAWLTFMAMGVEAHVFARSFDEWKKLLETEGFSNVSKITDGSFEGYGIIKAIKC
ncbi:MULTISPECIES: methyltransferase [Bacillus]|uniref:methyltransferase n=1 Tax=Bacillus TaxID=1386 RepID=UPI0024529F29|nr:MULTISPECIES: methyltransferase [Bacillus]MDH3081266.1 methyltransferase [Bacillus amyloliquefaciens]MDU0074643.1 methyltransferase [Bacillus sp. IG2]MDU0100353.1 methyltransferase [Bacillus sp. IS1]MEC2272984.1 methyltransferase [Bacillus velezensis]MED3677453.1 methyltransferase [Bacillus velezensis]